MNSQQSKQQVLNATTKTAAQTTAQLQQEPNNVSNNKKEISAKDGGKCNSEQKLKD